MTAPRIWIVLSCFQEEGFKAVNWVGCLFLVVCLIALVAFDVSRKENFLYLFRIDGWRMEQFLKTKLGLHSPR